MKLPPWLFWWDWVKKIIWDPFWWLILFIIILWVPFLRVWWWVFLPLMLQRQLIALYIWWIDWDYAYANTKWVILELVPPKEVLVPLKAMEDVFNSIWPTIYDRSNFRERWCDGALDNAPGWSSWEVVSTEGKLHFYLRILAQHQTAFETAFYNHYPDVEIHRVPDYTKIVPPTVPNEEWDTYGEDFDLFKEDAYPIKTYEKFFEPQGERISAEEKRIDPIISLLEGMSKLGPGEHYWVQFITASVTDYDESDWIKEGEKKINELSKRPVKKEPTFMEDVTYLLSQLLFGPQKEGEGEKASYKWVPQQKEESGEREMVLTPGEREIITEIENKLKKPAFRTTVRGIYVAKREEWVPSHRILLRSYMAHFMTNNLNFLGFSNRTRPKVHYFWRERRVFLRSRRVFRNAILRLPPLFPKRMSDDVNPILSSEEMATLYHFPLRTTGMLSPSLSKVDAKKSGPPSNLPISSQ